MDESHTRNQTLPTAIGDWFAFQLSLEEASLGRPQRNTSRDIFIDASKLILMDGRYSPTTTTTAAAATTTAILQTNPDFLNNDDGRTIVSTNTHTHTRVSGGKSKSKATIQERFTNSLIVTMTSVAIHTVILWMTIFWFQVSFMTIIIQLDVCYGRPITTTTSTTDNQKINTPFDPFRIGNVVGGGNIRGSQQHDDTSSTVNVNNNDKNNPDNGGNLIGPTPRIIDGTPTIRGRFPYHVSFLSVFGGSHTCGGSLIAPDIILTAAHCEDLALAQIGRYNRADFTEPYEERSISREVRHPAYRSIDFKYDYMIVQLDSVSTFPTVKLNTDPNLPVPLQTTNSTTATSRNINNNNNASVVVAAGFGVTEYNEVSLGSEGTSSTSTTPQYNEPSIVLQTVTLNTITNEECEKAKDEDSYQLVYQMGYNGLISPDMLCATGKGDTCLGDSGGPLIMPGSSLTGDDDIQVGVTSWGFGCGLEEFPGVYARVSHQYEWIRQTVCAISTNPPTSFDCNAATPSPGPPPKEVQVTIIIRMDDYPSEVGWYITDESNFGVMVENRPMGTYADAPNRTTIYETVTLQEGSTYTFWITDAAADGLCCSTPPGSYLVVYGVDETGEVIASGGDDYGREEFHQFTIPTVTDGTTLFPTASPTTTPPSTLQPTAVPSQTPTTSNPTTTASPTFTPTKTPTSNPTMIPTAVPTEPPTSSPSHSMMPSVTTSSSTPEPTSSSSSSSPTAMTVYTRNALVTTIVWAISPLLIVIWW